MPDDPEKIQTDKAEAKEPEQKQEPTPQPKVEAEIEQEEKFIEIPCSDNQQRKYTPVQCMQLMQYAEHDLRTKRESEEKPEPKEEPEDLSAEVKKLNKDLQDFKEGTRRENALVEFKAGLQIAVKSYDLFKEHGDLTDDAMLMAASLMSQNPNLSAKDAVGKYVKTQQAFMKKLEEKRKTKKSADTKIFAATHQTDTGSGGIPQIERQEPRKYKEVKSGESRRALADFLRSFEGEN